MKKIILSLALACGLAQAQTAPVPPPWISKPFECMPATAWPGAVGSAIATGGNAIGWYVAWWCPGSDRPQVYAVRWDAAINPLETPWGKAMMRDPHTSTANELRLQGEDVEGPRLAPIWKDAAGIAKIMAVKPK